MSNKIKRIIFFVLFMMFSFTIPVVVVMIRYKMFSAFFKASTKIQISIMGCLIILILALVNIKHIIKFLNEMPFSVFKCILNGLFKLIPLICLLLILVNIEKVIDDLTFVTSWVLGCNAISLFVFEPLWQHYTREYNIDIEYTKWKVREDRDNGKTKV